MKCTSPGCTGELEPNTISHQIVYRERTWVIHSVPAEVCPDCGEARIVEETLFEIEDLLGRKARSKSTTIVFEPM